MEIIYEYVIKPAMPYRDSDYMDFILFEIEKVTGINRIDIAAFEVYGMLKIHEELTIEQFNSINRLSCIFSIRQVADTGMNCNNEKIYRKFNNEK